MVKLNVRDRESIQEAVRRFRKLVERSGIKKEMRRREYTRSRAKPAVVLDCGPHAAPCASYCSAPSHCPLSNISKSLNLKSVIPE